MGLLAVPDCVYDTPTIPAKYKSFPSRAVDRVVWHSLQYMFDLHGEWWLAVELRFLIEEVYKVELQTMQVSYVLKDLEVMGYVERAQVSPGKSHYKKYRVTQRLRSLWRVYNKRRNDVE